jgi:hypothetical protein
MCTGWCRIELIQISHCEKSYTPLRVDEAAPPQYSVRAYPTAIRAYPGLRDIVLSCGGTESRPQAPQTTEPRGCELLSSLRTRTQTLDAGYACNDH